MLATLAEAGLPAPEFYDNGLSFTAIINARDSQRAETPAKPQLPPSLQAVIDLLGEHTTDLAELAVALGATEQSVMQRLYRLRKLGLIESDGGRRRRTTYRRAKP